MSPYFASIFSGLLSSTEMVSVSVTSLYVYVTSTFTVPSDTAVSIPVEFSSFAHEGAAFSLFHL